MKIKQIPQDFVVKEIPSSKAIGQGEYIWCTLKKTNWDLLKLLGEISRKLQLSRSKIGYAGTKDKVAVTHQTLSFFGTSLQKLRSLEIKGMELSDFEYNQRAITLGELKGNSFSITVRDLETRHTKDFLEKRIKEVNKTGIINLFGSQRFGTRNITHLVGKDIIKGRVPEAVFLYLTKTNKDEPKDVQDARKFLARTEDFKEAIKMFPNHCKWDIAILNHLIRYPGDFAGAIRSLPKTLSMMFIHAYQSYIWNLTANQLYKKYKENIEIPVVGFSTILGNSEVDKTIKKILDREKVRQDEFRIKEISELSSSGSKRSLYIYPQNITYKLEKDELNKGKNKVIIEFELLKGSYGTEVVKEIFN